MAVGKYCAMTMQQQNGSMTRRALIVALALALPVHAQNNVGPHVPPPGFDASRLRPLQERTDLLSWKLLAEVDLVRMKDRYVPRFSANVLALDRKHVKVQGFMIPLQVGDRQTHFVLAAMPQTCAFCMPGGPESSIEVKMKKPVKYTFEPVTVTGRIAVLKEDPTGVFYRIVDAQEAN
jgi:uncharacterized protein